MSGRVGGDPFSAHVGQTYGEAARPRGNAGATVSPPLKGLRAAGRRLWRDVTEAYDLRPDELAVLREMARQVDELDRLAAALADIEPVTVGSKGQPVAHPLLAEARGARLVLARLTSTLSLPDEGTPGMTAKQRHAQRAADARWRAEHVAEVIRG